MTSLQYIPMILGIIGTFGLMSTKKPIQSIGWSLLIAAAVGWIILGHLTGLTSLVVAQTVYAIQYLIGFIKSWLNL